VVIEKRAAAHWPWSILTRTRPRRGPWASNKRVIATSLVLIAVFVPVSFFARNHRHSVPAFSLTIAFSIAISAFNALTLSPALSAMFLRGEEQRPHQLDFSTSAPSRAHLRLSSTEPTRPLHGWPVLTPSRFMLRWRLRYLLLLVFFAGLGATVWMYQHVPTGLFRKRIRAS